MIVICCVVHLSISTSEGLHHEDEVAEKHPLPPGVREKRSNKNNATPNMPDILKRLQALEEKHDETLKSANLTTQRLQELEKRQFSRVGLFLVSAALELVLDSGIAGAGLEVFASLELCYGEEDSGSPGVLYSLTKELFLLYTVPLSAFKVISCPSLVWTVHG
ncbi:hypothetical protein ACROYT_G011771 [Oculina patagonica]